MKHCLIMRGLPGSGKGHWVRNLNLCLKEAGHYNVDLGLRVSAESAVVVSADDYFTDSDGVYRFDPMQIGTAHTECMKRFLLAVGSDEPLVIVDNTNICAFEISPYAAVAAAMGYETRIIQIKADVETCIQRNLHRVAGHVIGGMQEALRRETLPPWWAISVISNY